MRVAHNCLTCVHLKQIVNPNTVLCLRREISKRGLIEENLSEVPICKCAFYKNLWEQQSQKETNYSTGFDGKFLYGSKDYNPKKKRRFY